MYKKLFEVEADKTLESVNAAIKEVTGDDEWTFNSIEEIEKQEHEGFLEFKDGIMTVYVDGTL